MYRILITVSVKRWISTYIQDFFCGMEQKGMANILKSAWSSYLLFCPSTFFYHIYIQSFLTGQVFLYVCKKRQNKTKEELTVCMYVCRFTSSLPQ